MIFSVYGSKTTYLYKRKIGGEPDTPKLFAGDAVEVPSVSLLHRTILHPPVTQGDCIFRMMLCKHFDGLPSLPCHAERT